MSATGQPLKQRLLACFCHVAGALAASYLINAIVSMALAKSIKQEGFAKQHAVQAADFNLSFTVYALGGLFAATLLTHGVLDIAPVMGLDFSQAESEALTKKIRLWFLGVIIATYLILVCIASVRALRGRDHRYPFSLGWYQRIEALGAKNANNP